MVTVVVLFWVVTLGMQVVISVHLIRNKPPSACSKRGLFYRAAAIGGGFIPLPIMATIPQLIYLTLYRNQLRHLRN